MNGSAGSQVLGGSAAQLVGKAVGVLAGLGSMRILTGYLGPDGYGIYVTATAFLALVVMVSDGGLGLLTVMEISQPLTDERRFVTVMLWGRVALSVAVALVASLIAALAFGSRVGLLASVALLLVFLPPLAVASGSGAVLQAHSLMPRLALIEAMVRVATLFGLLAATRADLGLKGCLGVVGAGWVVHSALLLAAIPPESRPSISPAVAGPAEFGRLLRRSLPLGVASLVNGVYFRVDAVMVAMISGIHIAGQYGVAYRGLELLLLAPSAFGAALLPALSRAASTVAGLQVLVNRALHFVLIAMTPLVAVVWITSPFLVGMLGGPEFSGSAQLLRILAVAAWFSSLDIVLGLAIVVSGVQGRLLWINLGALLLNVVGNLLLIPRMGAAGAAVMTAACEVAVLIAAAGALRRVIGLRISPPRFGRLVVAASALGITSAFLANTVSWLLATSLALTIYSVVLVGLGGLAREDLPVGRRRGIPA